MTPNWAFLGSELRLAIDLVMETPPELAARGPCVSEVADGIVNRMRNGGIFVREQFGRAAVSMKTRYDTKLKPAFEMNVGDADWYFLPRRYAKRSPK